MALRATPEIDFSTFPESDGEPMAETLANATQMMDLMFTLRQLLHLQGRTRVAVGGNQFLYYNPRNGRDHVSPDVYAALDVEPGGRPTWKTWEEGKCPDVVFEISSPSTKDQDLGFKRGLYARLGAQEYYIYDPQREMEPAFLGYQLRGGRLEPMAPLASGGIMSPLLGAELRPMAMEETDERPGAIYLRVINPATGEPFRVADEVMQDYDELSADHRALTERLREAEAYAREADERLREIGTQVKEAKTYAQEVEAHAQELEAQAKEADDHLRELEAQARETEAYVKEVEIRAAREERERLALEERVARMEEALRAIMADPQGRTGDDGETGAGSGA